MTAQQMDLIEARAAASAPVIQALPCISLWQPYASLVAVEAKPWETRHWPAPQRLIGKRIAIHAAKRRPTRAELNVSFGKVADALGFCHWHDRIPYGAVVCTALLVGSHQVTHYGHHAAMLTDGRVIADDGFGDYSAGRWCWELRDVEPLRQPATERGRQGWWTWTGSAA